MHGIEGDDVVVRCAVSSASRMPPELPVMVLLVITE